MKQVRFTFYRSKCDIINVIKRKRKLHILDDLIALGTWLPNLFTPWYSHWEGWIAGRNGNFKIFCHDIDTEASFPKYVGTCYTSTMRGDYNGTVSRPASKVFKNPERWEYLEFEVTDESFAEAKAWADERVEKNKGYSKPDLRRFFMPLWLFKKLELDDPDRDICSEFGEGMAVRLVRISQTIWFFLSAIEYKLLDKVLIRSPRRLWRDLVRRHHVVTRSLATGKIVRYTNGKKVKT